MFVDRRTWQVDFSEVADGEERGVQQAVLGDGGERGQVQEHSQGVGLLMQGPVRGDGLQNTNTSRQPSPTTMTLLHCVTLYILLLFHTCNN